MTEGTSLSMETRSIADVIKERIQASYASLVPEDAWQKLVQGQIARLSEPELRRDAYGREEWLDSPLQRMVRAELERIAKEELAKVLASEEFSSNRWVNGRAEASKLVHEICRQNAAEMMATVMAPVAQQAVMQLRQILMQR